MEQMTPSTFYNLCSSFTEKSALGVVTQLEAMDPKDLSNEQLEFVMDRQLKKTKNKPINSLF